MADTKMLVENYKTEMRRGVLVMAVLSQLYKPAYGYDLVRTLSEKDLPIEGNTVYPLLRRLEAQGLLSSDWNTEGAKPRKFYVITAQGKKLHTSMKDYWYRSIANVHDLLENQNDK